MPDLVRLRNVSGQDLSVAPLRRTVEADCIVEIPRRVYEHQETCSRDDCAGCRVWPDATWRNETPAARKGKP